MSGRLINIVFDGPPGPNTGGHHCQFVEVEDAASGRSVSIGEWIKHPTDGLWSLQVTVEESSVIE